MLHLARILIVCFSSLSLAAFGFSGCSGSATSTGGTTSSGGTSSGSGTSGSSGGTGSGSTGSGSSGSGSTGSGSGSSGSSGSSGTSSNTAFTSSFGTLSGSGGCDGKGNCYVYKGASGSGSGVDWTNAYTGFGTNSGQIAPSGMQRGVIYWIAAGDYGSPTFSTPDSGTLGIEIEAATDSANGAASDWNSSYAGQAIFDSNTTIITDHWAFNGQSRGSDWVSGYNIKFWNQAPNSDYAVGAQSSTGQYSNWAFDYVEIEGTNTVGSQYSDEGFSCYSVCNSIYIGNSWIHNTGSDNLSLNGPNGGGSGLILEYNWISYNHSGLNSTHSQCIQTTVSDFTARYNIWQDCMSSGFITDASAGSPQKSGWYIYGNIFFWDPAFASLSTSFVGDGIIGDFNTTPTGSYFVNNTIYGLSTNNTCNAFAWYTVPTDAVTENNLWEGTSACNPSNPPIGTWDYNAYFSGSNDPADNSPHVQRSSASAFVTTLTSTSSGSLLGFTQLTNDLKLLNNTNAGISLPSPYNMDMEGVTRGSGGVWSRGALQAP